MFDGNFRFLGEIHGSDPSECHLVWRTHLRRDESAQHDEPKFKSSLQLADNPKVDSSPVTPGLNDNPRFHRAIASLIQAADEHAALLDAAYERNDFEEITLYVQKIKGAAGSIGSNETISTRI